MATQKCDKFLNKYQNRIVTYIGIIKIFIDAFLFLVDQNRKATMALNRTRIENKKQMMAENVVSTKMILRQGNFKNQLFGCQFCDFSLAFALSNKFDITFVSNEFWMVIFMSFMLSYAAFLFQDCT